MTDITLTTDPVDLGAPRYHLAYEQYLPDIAAVTDEQLVPITLDINKVTINTLGVISRIAAVAEELESRQLVASETLRRLPGYVMALQHAHVRAAMVKEGQELAATVEDGAQLREILLADARALIQRKLLPPNCLDGLLGGRGYRNVGYDLMALATLLRSNWSQINGRSALSQGELDRAESMADQIYIALGERTQGTAPPADLELDRKRAYSLFVRAYEEVRRGVVYLRWHEGDADEIAPSLYAGRGKRTGRRAIEEVAPTAEALEAADDVSETEAPLGFSVPPTAAGDPGIPGGNPFAS